MNDSPSAMPRPATQLARTFRAATRRSIFAARHASARYRRLPELIVIGAQKSGTSSLYAYLSQHPELAPSYTKEVHFFDGGLDPAVDNFAKGPAWYRAHFPLQESMSGYRRAFEASPLYLFSPLAPKRIAQLIPEVRLIAVLRSPVERAISQYFHTRRLRLERLPMMEAFRAEEERLAPLLAREDFKHESFIHHSYKRRGLYAAQLTRYLEHFPASRLLVIASEQLFSNTAQVLGRVFRFAGVDPGYVVGDLGPRNFTPGDTEADPEVYDYLERYFRPHNAALFELLGEDFGW